MNNISSVVVSQFNNLVSLKFQLYNSLFTSLPFHRIEKTGILLSLLQTNCSEGYKKDRSPVVIIDDFFNRHTSYTEEKKKIDLLFRFVQYAERQVVLFDAVEDAAFRQLHDMNGSGTLKQLDAELQTAGQHEKLQEKLRDFCVRLVLTAHPTQFYPGAVLAIINDLSKALAENNTLQINMYLQQLGKTAFLNKQKPTPFDEATSLIWYLENIFYPAAGKISGFMRTRFSDAVNPLNPVIKMGFWPGGDKDGNPFVTADTALRVADALRGSIIKCYYLDVRKIKRRLTFEGVEAPLAALERKLYNNIFIPGYRTELKVADILDLLEGIRQVIINQHNGLFLHLVDDLINKVNIFGLHFASLDFRQHSSVHGSVLNMIAEKTTYFPEGYPALTKEQKINAMAGLGSVDSVIGLEGIEQDSIDSIAAIKQIQQHNGEAGCNRYIISHCKSLLHVMEVYALFLLAGWKKEEINIDIIPLFETVDDLQNAAATIKELFENSVYLDHLSRRGSKQTIMMGFSDGTKDGGYLMANWCIYKAKEEITTLARKNKIDVIFFDGRGGPPARGGGKTHKFYASMGRNISGKEIQLTVQGQTISSNFGTIDSAQFNMEQLIHAGISVELLRDKSITLDSREEDLLLILAETSYQYYQTLKDHPHFVEYLLQVSPLRFYSETNIGSRPSNRGNSNAVLLEDLRAIPFVGSWSQIKQNVTGYYGVGKALEQLETAGRFEEVKRLYKESSFVKTLFDNCEMSMSKCFFPLTAYLSSHPRFGEIWQMIRNEYELTRHFILKLSGHTELMEDYPVDQLSIRIRERIVLPLLTIQQYAISKIRDAEESPDEHPLNEIYGKLAMRCSFGIINAGRNSA